jgi:hypothetical protein
MYLKGLKKSKLASAMAAGLMFGIWSQDKPKEEQEFRPGNGKHDTDKLDNISIVH